MIGKLLAISVLSWLVLGALFLGYPTLQRLSKIRDQLHWTITIPAYFGFAVGLLADIIFNATWGSVIFRSPPKELTFTERVQRYADNGDARALRWAARINMIDPEHIKL